MLARQTSTFNVPLVVRNMKFAQKHPCNCQKYENTSRMISHLTSTFGNLSNRSERKRIPDDCTRSVMALLQQHGSLTKYNSCKCFLWRTYSNDVSDLETGKRANPAPVIVVTYAYLNFTSHITKIID